MDFSSVQGLLCSLTDVLRSIKIRLANLKVNNRLSLFFHSSGKLHHLSDFGKRYVFHSVCLFEIVHFIILPFDLRYISNSFDFVKKLINYSTLMIFMYSSYGNYSVDLFCDMFLVNIVHRKTGNPGAERVTVKVLNSCLLCNMQDRKHQRN